MPGGGRGGPHPARRPGTYSMKALLGELLVVVVVVLVEVVVVGGAVVVVVTGVVVVVVGGVAPNALCQASANC